MKREMLKILFIILLAGGVASISTRAQQNNIIIQDASYSQTYSNDFFDMSFNLTPRIIFEFSDCGSCPSLFEPDINISYPLMTASERIIIGSADFILGNVVRVSPDLNKDGAVDIIDVTIVAAAFGSKPGHPKWNPKADLDGNEFVNIVDISIVAKEFHKLQIENFNIGP